MELDTERTSDKTIKTKRVETVDRLDIDSRQRYGREKITVPLSYPTL